MKVSRHLEMLTHPFREEDSFGWRGQQLLCWTWPFSLGNCLLSVTFRFWVLSLSSLTSFSFAFTPLHWPIKLLEHHASFFVLLYMPFLIVPFSRQLQILPWSHNWHSSNPGVFISYRLFLSFQPLFKSLLSQPSTSCQENEIHTFWEVGYPPHCITHGRDSENMQVTELNPVQHCSDILSIRSKQSLFLGIDWLFASIQSLEFVAGT